jgi:membrane protein implicated in regulation of membrane protease activity
MTTMRTLKKLLFGETWLLPIGIAAVIVVALVIRPLLGHVWTDVGGFVLLAGVVAVLLTCVSRTARR